MEILMTLLNQTTLEQVLYAVVVVSVLVMLLVYHIVIAPKIKIRKVLAKVRQIQYEKEIKKARYRRNDNTFTWGTFTRSKSNTAYEVKEFSPEEDNTIHKIMRDLSPEEITNIREDTLNNA